MKQVHFLAPRIARTSCALRTPRFALASMAAAAALAWPTPPVAAAEAAPPVHVTLLALNDFHGNLVPPVGSVRVPVPGTKGGQPVAAGGAAYLATLVQQERARNPQRTLVVGAGDMLGASPLMSGVFFDEPTVQVLDTIGLDISSVGNHEFDRGRAELLRIQHGGCHPANADGSEGRVGVDTCLDNGRFDGAHYTYLAANVIDQTTGAPILPAYALRDVGGVRIGFIGLTLRETPSMVNAAGIRGLEFHDEVQTVNRLVPDLQAQGADAIVVLIHQGGRTTAATVQDKSCPGFSGAIVELADRFDPAVAVVVSGHTHEEYVCSRPDGKLVTQTGYYGRLITRIDLLVDPQRHQVVAKDANNLVVANDRVLRDKDGQPLPLPPNWKPLAPEPRVQALVDRYGALTQDMNNLIVGRIPGPLLRHQNAAGESSLGDFVADAFLTGTSDPALGPQAAQIGMTNPGGIRSELPDGGVVRFGQLYTILPFNNTLVTMTLTGRQLYRVLEQQWEQPQPHGGRVLSVSEGLQYQWDARAPEGAAPGQGRRVVGGSLRLHGEPVQDDARYRVTVNSFLAAGGDNFTVFREGTQVTQGPADLEVVKLYLRAAGQRPVPAATRIGRLDAQP